LPHDAEATKLTWIATKDGTELALDGLTLVARGKKGEPVKAVPKKAKESEVGLQLAALAEWLEAHETECTNTVESWMLRSLPVSTKMLGVVWEDLAWRRALENAIVAPGHEGKVDSSKAGLFKGVDPTRGLGVVSADGETRWIEATHVALPHPVLLDGLDDWRELSTELGLTQGIQQLFRETHPRDPALAEARANDAFEGGEFEKLTHAWSRCRKLGYRTRGGFACCRVWDGAMVEARFWIGDDDPESPAVTGELIWVDAAEHQLALGAVGPVAYSDGVRMAAGIHAGRKLEKEAV